MKHVEFDKNGTPLFSIGSGVLIESTKIPSNATVNKGNGYISIKGEPTEETKELDTNLKIACWYEDNDFPNKIQRNYLERSSVLRSAINYKVDLAVAQGVFACHIIGYDEQGNEKIEVIPDIELHRFLRSRSVFRYIRDAHFNIYSHGIAFPQIIPAQNGKLADIVVLKSPDCRFSARDKDGIIQECYVSGNWEKVKERKALDGIVKVLDTTGTDPEIQARATLMKESFIFPISYTNSYQNYYPAAPWDTARASGYLDISLKISKYLESMFENQMSIKYHIRIPYAYWDKKYPTADYISDDDKKRRKELIEKDLDEIENNLTGSENAKKAIVSHFEINQQGQAEEKWEIDVLDDKYKSDQYLPHAASSNVEICTALGVNPVVKGLSMAAGPYANNQGGSNIREAFLIDDALAWSERQEVYFPLELMLRINFPQYDDIEIRTRSLRLTTLDTGGGTQKVIS